MWFVFYFGINLRDSVFKNLQKSENVIMKCLEKAFS